MDVQCERCKTEYEFDDALVSGRGTTVKCTNCGLQFKVRPSGDTQDMERWIVHTARGQELIFTSLRELQRAITSHEVGRGDTLRRGNASPRTLGTIAELEPFFLARPSRSQPPPAMDGGKSRMPTLRPPSAMAVPPSTAPARLAPVSGAVDRTAAAYSEAGTLMAPALQAAPVQSVLSREQQLEATYPVAADTRPGRNELPRQPAPVPQPQYQPQYQPAPQYPPEAVQPVPRFPPPAATPNFNPPTDPVMRRQLPPTISHDYGDGMNPRDSLSDEVGYSHAPPRRRMGGWIVAAVLLVCVTVIGYKVAEPYLTTAGAKAPARKALDPRAEQFLTEGESAFKEGNLELAKEKFDKASALAESDPRVLLDIARLAAARADVPWLMTRLLPESAADDLKVAKQQLTDLGAAAKHAAEVASSASPEDNAATRAHVDALRIVGERDAARGYVTKIIGNASQPETSYVLAALDLAEIDPLWATVIDRLRVAAAGEGNAGRARAALVYALARSGDVVGAKAELDRIKGPATPPALVSALAAFVGRATATKGAPSASASATRPAPVAVVDVNSLPRSGGGGGGEEPTGGGGDSRDLLKQAANAENRGQFSKAMKLYEDAMHSDPSNSEALAGLGSVSLKTGDFSSARSYFGKALAVNPNFVPALVGQADAMWAEGDHAGATGKYKDIVDRFPESAGYPSYVKTRAEGSASGPSAGSPPADTPAPKPKAPLPPGTSLPLPADLPSDLPGTPP